MTSYHSHLHNCMNTAHILHTNIHQKVNPECHKGGVVFDGYNTINYLVINNYINSF